MMTKQNKLALLLSLFLTIGVSTETNYHDYEGEEDNLKDGDLSCFIRLGTDFISNYYEYEISLKPQLMMLHHLLQSGQHKMKLILLLRY